MKIAVEILITHSLSALRFTITSEETFGKIKGVTVFCLFVSIISVGQEPDIPDLIDYMQSGDEVKVINAAGYLQHLCYSKETVKDKVRY